MFRERHYSTDFTHPKYEVNQTTRVTVFSEIDIRESGDCSSVRPKCISPQEDKELPYTSCSGDSVNPVSELYNYCSSQKWSLPVYALLSAEGPLHNQTFTVGCRILGQPEIGKGSASTKKEAKRAASLSLLEKIKTNKPPSSLSYSKNSLCCENTESDSCQNVKNAITTLHETCASFRWPHPTYEVLNEDGPSNSKVFTIGCSVVGYTPVVQGMGHTKSEAKHAASQALLEKIKKEDFTSDSRSTCICGENEKLTLSETKDPTSTLHELCASRSWPYPDYELLSEVGPANYKVFTIGCVVRGYSEIGKGSGQSKTAAKHEASRAVLNQLKTASLLEDSSMNNSPLSILRKGSLKRNMRILSVFFMNCVHRETGSILLMLQAKRGHLTRGSTHLAAQCFIAPLLGVVAAKKKLREQHHYRCSTY